jgi:hypothetical protein
MKPTKHEMQNIKSIGKGLNSVEKRPSENDVSDGLY